jgi:hypothetical protein
LTLRSKPRFLSGLLPFERPEPQISQMVLKGLDQREKGEWASGFSLLVRGSKSGNSEALVPKRVITHIITHQDISGWLQKIVAYHHGMPQYTGLLDSTRVSHVGHI